MEILVTGGAGFIGSSFLNYLDYKNNKVIVIDDLSNGKLENIKQKVNFIKDDLIYHRDTGKYDVIYHFAAVNVNARNPDPDLFLNNILLTQKVIRMLKYSGKFYFSSSCSIYGNSFNAKENDNYNPITPYGYSKVMCEELIKKHCKNYTMFRIGLVFGDTQSGNNEQGIVAIAKKCLIEKQPLKLYNNGFIYRDFIHINDVCSAFANIKDNGIYNIGSNKMIRIKKLLNSMNLKYINGGNTKEPLFIKLNNKKLLNTGWEPTINIHDYIKDMLCKISK